jgi:hypothetical protein
MTLAVPLTDLGRLQRARRRTSVVRAVLAALLVGLVLTAAAVAARPVGRTVLFFPKGSNGIVVLDLSASISSDTFQRIGETLRELASTRGRYGLVIFSDVAYEALPPGTPAANLNAYARFFTLPPAVGGFLPPFPTNPWINSFSGGTRISAGLGLALRLVRQDALTRPGVVLVSDLNDDPGDLKDLASVSLAYRQAGVPVRIVALNAAPTDQQLFVRLLSQAATVQAGRLPGERAQTSGSALPAWLIALVLTTALALAVNELWSARLVWGRA